MRPPAAELARLRDEAARELSGGILPYWMRRVPDERRGGFVGFIGGDERRDPDAGKGAILNARILWTFAAASRALGDPALATVAERAARYFRAHFLDPAHGGVYWMLDADGRPIDDRKHVYAQAFAIYALAEHHRATGDAASLEDAAALFRLVEAHAHDARHGGYEEAFAREWTLLDDVRLSAGDANERKSMNTHLHVLEGYTNLLRVWPDPLLRSRLAELLDVFAGFIVDAGTGHQHLFFDADWTPKSAAVSYGHDIEASWLLLEAADVLGDPARRALIAPLAARLARGVLDEAFDPVHGGIYDHARPDEPVDTDKEWWPQAEAVVGFLSAWEESGRAELLRGAVATWDFVRRHLVDGVHGEWHRRVSREGAPRPGHEKVGPWKGPYHGARACLEILARTVAPALEVPA